MSLLLSNKNGSQKGEHGIRSHSNSILTLLNLSVNILCNIHCIPYWFFSPCPTRGNIIVTMASITALHLKHYTGEEWCPVELEYAGVNGPNLSGSGDSLSQQDNTAPYCAWLVGDLGGGMNLTLAHFIDSHSKDLNSIGHVCNILQAVVNSLQLYPINATWNKSGYAMILHSMSHRILTFIQVIRGAAHNLVVSNFEAHQHKYNLCN